MKKGKLSGVKRVMILALVPDIKETHRNIHTLFDIVNINNIEYKIVADYKAMLITLGLQTSTATYPCPFCIVHKDDLAQESENVPERTFQLLKQDHEKFVQEYQGDKKNAKHCHSTVNPCLLTEDQYKAVLEKFIFPELHTVLGVVNHLFFKGLVPLLKDPNDPQAPSRAFLWPLKLGRGNVEKYHGGTFEGNDCKVLLSNPDILTNPDILGEVKVEEVQPFIRTFHDFNKLVDECFSTKLVDMDKAKRFLSEFQKSYKTTGVSCTPKVHTFLHHLVRTLKLPYFKGRGLGVCTEQAGESFHSFFKESFWKKREIKQITHPQYAERLRLAVVECASKAL